MSISYYVQAVPERLEYIKENIINKDKFNSIPTIKISLDYNHKGCIYNMLAIFNNIETDYALILQDDVILPKRFYEYIEKKVIKDIKDKNIDLLYLYISPKKEYDKYETKEVNYIVLNDTGQQAYIISKSLAKIVLSEYKQAEEKKHDDFLLQEICNKHKIKIYHHLPGIVQHNAYLKSIMKNPRNLKHKISRLYNPEIINRYLK